MTALTPKLKLPYPESTDNAAGHLQLKAIADAIDTVFGDHWDGYQPDVVGPTSYSVRSGWKQIGKTVHYSGRLEFTDFYTVSTTITISFPVAPMGTRNIGVGYCAGESSNVNDLALVAVQSGTVFIFKRASASSVSGTYPYSGGFQSGDYLAWNFVYEVS